MTFTDRGEVPTKRPIYLEMPSGEIRELAEQSHIVSAMATILKSIIKYIIQKRFISLVKKRCRHLSNLRK